jgi:Domain of unknown function (DUF4386)
MERFAETSLRPMARITGVVCLLYFLRAVSSELFIRGIIVSGNPAATATNILAHERSFRLSVAVGLIATALYIAVTVLFYGLFKPVNKTGALRVAERCDVHAEHTDFLGVAGPISNRGDSAADHAGLAAAEWHRAAATPRSSRGNSRRLVRSPMECHARHRSSGACCPV